jgi:hypothetical protein
MKEKIAVVESSERDVGDVVGVEHEVRRIPCKTRTAGVTLNVTYHRCHVTLPLMVRQFKHHEKKLLKRVDFLNVSFYSLDQDDKIYNFTSGSKMQTFVRSK